MIDLISKCFHYILPFPPILGNPLAFLFGMFLESLDLPPLLGKRSWASNPRNSESPDELSKISLSCVVSTLGDWGVDAILMQKNTRCYEYSFKMAEAAESQYLEMSDSDEDGQNEVFSELEIAEKKEFLRQARQLGIHGRLDDMEAVRQRTIKSVMSGQIPDSLFPDPMTAGIREQIQAQVSLVKHDHYYVCITCAPIPLLCVIFVNR